VIYRLRHKTLCQSAKYNCLEEKNCCNFSLKIYATHRHIFVSNLEKCFSTKFYKNMFAANAISLISWIYLVSTCTFHAFVTVL
jgi:hypothetical protein